MTPILFESTETAFTSNGIGRLRDCISCVVTEERNGQFELELEYPIGGAYFDQLNPGNIIGVIHDDDHDIQPFEIYSTEATLDGATIYARHISYRLSDILVSPFTASTLTSAISGISSHSVNTNPFTLSTDKSGSGEFAVSYPKSARSALLGEEGSILDVYGGEYEWDKWNVTLHAARGSDTGVTVRYGKNMLGLEREIDGGETFNAVAPYVMDGDTYVYLPEFYVQPTNPPNEPLKIRSMDFSGYFESTPAEATLRANAKSWIDSNKPWIPSQNLKVDFVALWQTEQYKDVAEIQRVRLCDTVSVYYTNLGIVAEKQKVVKTVFDVLKERLTQIELGTTSTQFVAIEATGTSAGNSSPFIAETVSGTGQSVSGGGNYTGSFSVSKAGYKPVALAGFSTGASSCVAVRFDLDVGAAVVYFNIRNTTSGAQTATPNARVVYIRNEG